MLPTCFFGSGGVSKPPAALFVIIAPSLLVGGVVDVLALGGVGTTIIVIINTIIVDGRCRDFYMCVF